jgi:hypothetical protein
MNVVVVSSGRDCRVKTSPPSILDRETACCQGRLTLRNLLFVAAEQSNAAYKEGNLCSPVNNLRRKTKEE